MKWVPAFMFWLKKLLNKEASVLEDPVSSIATGAEISFTSIPPKTELGHFHIHKKDEGPDHQPLQL
jgi:hypothetical protein